MVCISLVFLPRYFFGIEVAGGVSFIQKTLDSFNIRSSKTTLLVDMFGYDGFPALASIQEIQLHLE